MGWSALSTKICSRLAECQLWSFVVVCGLGLLRCLTLSTVSVSGCVWSNQNARWDSPLPEMEILRPGQGRHVSTSSNIFSCRLNHDSILLRTSPITAAVPAKVLIGQPAKLSQASLHELHSNLAGPPSSRNFCPPSPPRLVAPGYGTQRSLSPCSPSGPTERKGVLQAPLRKA